MKAFGEMIDDASDYLSDAGDYAHRAVDYVSDTIGSVSDHLPEVSETEMAHGLGWASLAIGLTELAAPKQVENLLGLDHSPTQQGSLRVLGVREICHGLSILSDSKPNKQMATGVWARVAGDALDTALLGVAATKTKKPMQFWAVAALVMAIGAADLMTAMKLSK